MLRRTVLLVVGALMITAAVSGQSNSVLRGRVVDQDKAAVSGATVTITGDQLQGVRNVTTDSGGEFAFLGLMPGNYRVSVTSAGFKELVREQVLLRAAQTIELSLPLEVEGSVSTVQVSALTDSPIVDVSTPEKNYNISGQFITQLPLNSRQTWEALWTMVPGVGGFPEGANYDPVINGAGGLNSGAPFTQGVTNVFSNSYTLNGFNIGNSFTNQGWRTQFSTEAIQDVVVKTAGIDASTPLAQGGAVNIVTKSGGNDFSGSAGFFMQPKNFNWTNVPGGTSSTLTLYQPDFSLGGPVILPWFGEGTPYFWKGKDKLWFFTTYRQVITNEGISRSAATLARFEQYGLPVPNFEREERSNRFTGKVSYQLNRDHSFIFNYLNDSGTVFNDTTSDVTAYEASPDFKAGGPTYQIVWTGNLAANLLWTAQYGYRKVTNDVLAKSETETSRILYESTTLSGGNRFGSGAVLLYSGNRTGDARTSLDRRPHSEFTTDLTWLTDFFGSHTIKTGFQFRPETKFTTRSVGPRRTVLSETIVNGVRVPFNWFEWDDTDFAEAPRSTIQHGFFGQDSWQVNPRLTLTVGTRFDRQEAKDFFGFTQFNTWTVDPRFGFALSLNKDRTDVIRGSWGRYSDILTLNYAFTLSGSLGTPGWKRYFDNDFDGTVDFIQVTPPTPRQNEPSNVSGNTYRGIDPDLTVSKKDEFQIGYTRQLPWGMVLDMTYVQSDFKDAVGNINTNYVYTDGLFTGVVDGRYNEVYVKTNLPNFKQKFRSFQASLVRNIGKRYSFFANYTYQKRTLKGEFALDDPQRYLHPADFFDDDKQVRPWLAAINGDARLPWGFKASAIVMIEAGNYGGYLTKILSTSDPDYTRHVPSITVTNPDTGATRSVSNPLRTTVRLLNSRSEGRLQTPTRTRVNLRLGKNFKMPWESHVIETAVDVFNVFNESTARFFSNSTRPDLASFGSYSSSVGAPRGVQLSFRYRF